MNAARGQCWVDVGFWGGVIPGNAASLKVKQTDYYYYMKAFSLKAMVDLGVPGFKCFLIHSGVDEFPAVTREQVNFKKLISNT